MYWAILKNYFFPIKCLWFVGLRAVVALVLHFNKACALMEAQGGLRSRFSIQYVLELIFLAMSFTTANLLFKFYCEVTSETLVAFNLFLMALVLFGMCVRERLCHLVSPSPPPSPPFLSSAPRPSRIIRTGFGIAMGIRLCCFLIVFGRVWVQICLEIWRRCLRIRVDICQNMAPNGWYQNRKLQK